MRKLLFLSVLVFFVVFSIETVGFNYVTGDHPYYITTGLLGQGHDLTLLVLRSMYLILPSFVRDTALPIFINFMFVFSIYFMLKPFVKYPEWVFLLAPLMPLSNIYAQIFAISFFNFMLGFYFRGKREVAPLFLVLVFLAHYWTGLFVAIIFTLYVLAFDRKSLRDSLLPTAIIAGAFFLILPQGIGFLTQAPIVVPMYYLTTAGFFILLSRGLIFFFLSFFGLWRLWIKDRGFFKINLMLFLIPFFIVFALPTSNYWDWRLLYFMPFLALVSVFMSYLFEGKSK
ncbi:MAG: hypothetical protein HWN68_09670 [Desulfobacterales bacterium]|nr:hypothetical protein [Desulfobacterales bacterium]